MNEKTVKLTVVVPVYNVENYISYTIKSLFAQSCKDFEIILVDDGSEDNSIEVATSALKKEDVPFSVIHQKNSGIGEARNTGLKNAKGKWVCFLDSDDIILPQTFEKMVEAGEKEKVDFVFSGYKNITDYSETSCEEKGVEQKFDGLSLQESFLYRKSVVLAPGTLYNREFLVNNNLYFEKLPWSEDQHFIWRVLGKIKSAYYLPHQFYRYYERQGSIMHGTPAEKVIDSFEYIKKLTKHFDENTLMSKYLVPRWIMGTLNATAIYMPYSQWKILYKTFEGKKAFKKLLGFKNKKVVLASLIGVVSKRIYYFIVSKK